MKVITVNELSYLQKTLRVGAGSALDIEEKMEELFPGCTFVSYLGEVGVL